MEKQGLAATLGLPKNKDEILKIGRADDVPALIDGQQPAALSQGEYVFSVPSILALGKGDYETGLKMLDDLHQQLRIEGQQYLQEGKGLEGV